MNDELGISHGMNIGMQKMQDTMYGAALGAQRLVSDVGAMMPEMPSTQMHPFIQARHGMYAHEMTMGGDIAAFFGRGIPKTTTAYEYQELAARDLGSRISTGLHMGAFHGAAALASWNMATASMGAGFRAGQRMGVGMAARAMTGTTSAKFAMQAGGMAKTGLKAGRLMGGLFGGAMGLAPLLALEAGVTKIAGDIADRQDITNYLEASSFRYATGTGADIDQKMGGFNVGAQNKIADTIKQVDLGDAFYDMKDLKGVLEQGTQLGMFSGTNDAEEFGRKFKNLTETLKKVTKTLHLSLADGMKVIKDMKDQGYSPGLDMNAAIMTADVLGSATGRTAAEMLSIGRQGAEMVRGTGISMSTGSRMFQNTMSNISMLSSSGALSGEMIAQAGGEGALAQGLMRHNIGFMQSNFGRGMMAAAVGPNGQLNLGNLDRLVGGETSLSEMASMGSANINDPVSYIKAVVNQNKNMRELGKQYGGQGIKFAALSGHMTAAREMTSRVQGLDMETALRFQMKGSGMSESEIEAQMAELGNVDELRGRTRAAMTKVAKKNRSELLSEKLDYIGRASDAIDEFLSPVSKAISNSINKVESKIAGYGNRISESFTSYMTDTELIKMDPMTNQDVVKALARGLPSQPGSAKELSAMFTDRDSAQFEDTKGYNALRREHSGKELTPAADNASNIDEYAKAIVGRSFDNLSRDEKMYVEIMAKRTGRSEIKQDMDKRQDKISQSIRNQTIESVKDTLAARDKAEENVDDVRGSAIAKIGFGSQNLRTGAFMRDRDAEAALSTKANREKFDELLMLKDDLKGIDINNIESSLEGKTKEEKIAILDKAIRARNLQGELEGTIRGSASDRKGAIKQFRKYLGSDAAAGAGAKLREGKAELSKRNEMAQAAQVQMSVSDSLNSILKTDLEAAGLEESFFGDSDEVSDFKTGISQLSSMFLEGGNQELEMDFDRMSKLSAKAGYGKLSEAFRKAGTIGEKGLTDMNKIMKLTGIEDKATLEAIMGDDKTLSATEFLKTQVGQDLADKTGSPVIMDKGDPDSAMGRKTAEVINSLNKVQGESANVYEQLRRLSMQLINARKGQL